MTCPNCGWEPWEPDHDDDGIGFPDGWGERATECAACGRESEHLIHFGRTPHDALCPGCFIGDPEWDFRCGNEVDR